MYSVQILPTIIQTWLDYLRLEDLANARVEKKYGSNYQQIINKGIGIAGNKLLLDKSLFEDLKQFRQDAISREDLENAPLALAFPTIRQVKGKGKTKRVFYLPLFTIDIAIILEGNYRPAGWDLLKLEPCPITANLIEFAGLEESDVDRLVVNEGSLRLLRDVFGRPFNILQDFLNQVDLPQVDLSSENCKSERAAYLIRTNIMSYNTQLKEELWALHKQSLDSSREYVWMQESHPAYSYLFGRPELPRHQVLFESAFAGTIPDQFQAQGLKHAQENRLTAIFGGPGSGKTELALHLISQLIFQRARTLVHENLDQSSLCVFASTNNGVLKKFQERLSSRISNQPFFLLGGNRQTIRSETLPKLREAIKSLEEQEFDSQEYELLKQKLVVPLSKG